MFKSLTEKKNLIKRKQQLVIKSDADEAEQVYYSNDTANTIYDNYYWIGKDYANTYKADFQNIQEFSMGIINCVNLFQLSSI